MTFSRKIGLSFLLLILLTALTGCIGLLFVYRVLSVLGGISANEGLQVRSLDELDQYIRKAVTISRQVSEELEIPSLLQLRGDFTRIINESERAFQELRQELEDETSPGELEQFGAEQQHLKSQTQALIGAMLADLQVEKKVKQAIGGSQKVWNELVQALGELAPVPGEAGGGPGPTRPPGGETFLLDVLRLQQSLLVIRLKLNEFLTYDDPQRPELSIEVRENLDHASALLESLSSRAVEDARTREALSRLSARFVAWRDIFVREQGVLDLYTQSVELKRRTDALSASIQSGARDTLRILDSLAAIRSRLLAGESGRGFITAAPTMLVLAIGAATLLSLLLAVVLTRAITRPVRRMIAATEAVRRGDYSLRLPVRSGDELARLADAFNRMVDEIDALNTGLEQRVKSRTAELEDEIRERHRVEEQIRQKQQQLIQADKLASLGILVAGVAHEISNPNQAILMGGQLLRKAWPDMRKVLDSYYRETGDFLLGGRSYSELGDTLAEHFSGIVRSAQRIETIIQGLKGFARQDPTEMTQTVNLNVAVKSALILLSNMLKKATDRLSVDLAPQLPGFRGNAQRIEQVVINLVQNACQALPDRGRGIFISSRFDADAVRVVLEVRDEGVGIAAEDLPRILDPFYTSKRNAGGTGLGLSVSSSIVKEHGGELEFLSAPGEGTTARAVFPVRRA